MKKIYFKEHNNASDLETLLKNFYNNINGYAYPTYNEPECISHECTGLRRSFEDLLCIANTYIPTTETQLMQALINIDMKFYHCNDINKIVFHYAGNKSINKFSFLEFKEREYVKNTYDYLKLIEIFKNL